MKMMSKFIEWREKNTEYIRFVLMSFTVICLIWEIINLMGYVQIISSPEYNEQFYNTDLKEFKDIDIKDTINLMEQDYISPQKNIKEIEYNPISKSIWALLNIQFYLFIITLLWTSQKSKD